MNIFQEDESEEEVEVKPKYAERKQNEYLACSFLMVGLDSLADSGELVFHLRRPKKEASLRETKAGVFFFFFFWFWCSYKKLSCCWIFMDFLKKYLIDTHGDRRKQTVKLRRERGSEVCLDCLSIVLVQNKCVVYRQRYGVCRCSHSCRGIGLQAQAFNDVERVFETSKQTF